MKVINRWKSGLLVVSLLIGFGVYLLLANGEICLDDPMILSTGLAFTALVVLTFFVIGLLWSPKSRLLKIDFCSAGTWAVLGASGLLISAFFVTLVGYCSMSFQQLFLALSFFFLALMSGGIFLFLHIYNDCFENECRC